MVWWVDRSRVSRRRGHPEHEADAAGACTMKVAPRGMLVVDRVAAGKRAKEGTYRNLLRAPPRPPSPPSPITFSAWKHDLSEWAGSDVKTNLPLRARKKNYKKIDFADHFETPKTASKNAGKQRNVHLRLELFFLAVLGNRFRLVDLGGI